MKKIILSVLIAALILTSLSGCGSRRDENDPGTNTGTENGSTVTPEDNQGVVQDQNGIIGDNNSNQSGVLPEVGGDIEQGTNDIIDDVGDAINGNDNNSGMGNNAEDNADSGVSRGRARMN